MTDPARRARPVGPPPPGSPPPPSRAPDDDARPGYDSGSRQPYVRMYSWSSTGQSFPWFAVLLLVLGVGLLIEVLLPDLSLGSLFILAIGVAFGVAWLYRGVIGATMPALVMTAWGLADVGRDLDILIGDGWNTLFIGTAFLIGWGLARYQGIRREYALWIGAILGLIGLADVSDTLPFDIGLAVVIPLAMIGIGAYMVWKSRVLSRP